MSAVYITSLETAGQGFIWDINVPATNNYVYGFTVSHNCNFDEEIWHPGWYRQGAVRGLVDRNGRFFWSATNEVGTERLAELQNRVDKGDPDISEYSLKIFENPYVGQAEREHMLKQLGEDELQIAYYGERASKGFRVYPEFDPEGIHGVEPFAIPPDWTRYMVIDPGRQVAAGLFAAVPPPEDEKWKNTIHLYDEFYIHNADAASVAKSIKEKCGVDVFHAWIIDWRGARKAQEGTGRTIESHYLDEIRKHDLSSETTGCGFIPGADDIRGREEAMRALLVIQPSGRPRLVVHKDKMKNFIWEMRKRRYATDREGRVILNTRSIPKRVDRDDHLSDSAEMLAAYNPQWHRATKNNKKISGAYRVFLADQEKEREKKRHKFGESTIKLGRGL